MEKEGTKMRGKGGEKGGKKEVNERWKKSGKRRERSCEREW